jgi:photosystem II stability/assembly factor-like uncharacterized protein
MIAVSPDFVVDRTLYISSRELGLHCSTDAGDTWRLLSGLPDEAAVFLALSPRFALDQTLYAGMRGSGVWVTTDRGETWAASNGGLPADEPLLVEGLACSPAYATDRTVLLSTHGWFYISRDAGQSWQRMPGYARVDEQLQTVRSSANWIQAATTGKHGSGVSTTSAPGAWQELTFSGDWIAFYANVGQLMGNVRVVLDGVIVAQVSLAAPVAASQACVWKHSFENVGWHTVRIVNAGGSSENPSSTINSDGFELRY